MNKKITVFLFSLLFGMLLLATTGQRFIAIDAESGYSEIVMEARTERVLYENNCDKVMPMASTTKILTALIIIEDCDLTDTFEIPAAACGIEGSSVYLVSGERLKISDLLYGLMLRSGNDCAVALALYHSKSVEEFAKVMNERAVAMGAENSRFANPHGLPADDHYTTARDLCKISCVAMRNEEFKKIVSTQSISVPDAGCGYDRSWVNKNKMLYNFEGANGVKTGYTKIAGRCLVSGAERDGMQLVSVVLNCSPMYERSAEILEQAFAKYSYRTVFEPWESVLPTDVAGKNCRVCAEQSFSFPLTEEEFERIQVAYELPEKLTLPIHRGAIVGEIKIYLENQLLFSQKIISIEDVKKSILDILREIANH